TESAKWFNATSPSLFDLGFQLIEQGLGVLHICSVKALGEPVVDVGEHRARLVAAIGVAQQARETDRCAQFPELGFLRTRDSDRLTEAVFSLRQAFQTSLTR